MKLQTIKIEDGDLTLSQLASRLKSRTAIITRKGKPLFQVSEIAGADAEIPTASARPKLLRKLAESEQDYFQNGGVSSAQVLKELGLAPKSPKRGLTMAEVVQKHGLKMPTKKRRRRPAAAIASNR